MEILIGRGNNFDAVRAPVGVGRAVERLVRVADKVNQESELGKPVKRARTSLVGLEPLREVGDAKRHAIIVGTEIAWLASRLVGGDIHKMPGSSLGRSGTYCVRPGRGMRHFTGYRALSDAQDCRNLLRGARVQIESRHPPDHLMTFGSPRPRRKAEHKQ